MPRYINDIIVHCSATKPDQDWGAAEVTACHQENGWKTCGYHYVVKRDGSVERGRAISQPGAHCRGHNAHSIGVCYIGGLDEKGRAADTRTDAQRSALLQLLAKLTIVYKCRIHGHRDYAAKDCPCFDVHQEYDNLYRQLALPKS